MSRIRNSSTRYFFQQLLTQFVWKRYIKCQFVDKQGMFLRKDNLRRVAKKTVTSTQLEDMAVRLNERLDKIDKTLHQMNNKRDGEVRELHAKIDALFYDNEVIKHQLMLEEEIRKYGQEIERLSSFVQRAIQDIDAALSGGVDLKKQA